jgi:dynein heavy chain
MNSYLPVNFTLITYYRITDGMNETKDKVRYLESLRRHFDLLYADATPYIIINTAVPGLLNTIKQMDSVSRFYARQGFLGLLLTKVSIPIYGCQKKKIS